MPPLPLFAQVCDAHSQRVCHTEGAHNGAVTCLRPHSTFVFSAADDAQALQWDAAEVRRVRSFRLQGPAVALALAPGPNGPKLFVSARSDCSVQMVDAGARPAAVGRAALTGHHAPVMALDAEGARLWSGAADGGIRVWEGPDFGSASPPPAEGLCVRGCGG